MYKSKGIIIGYSYFGSEHKNFKILEDNGIFSNYFIYKTKKNFDNSYNNVEPYNIVEISIEESKKISNVKLLKKFNKINLDFKKFIVISLFAELLDYSKVIYNSKKLYTVFYSFVNKLENIEKIGTQNYLVFIFSYIAINSGYFNLEGYCKKCGKKLTNTIYFSLNDFLEKCTKHKIPYSFKLPKKYFNYYKILIQKMDKKLIIPDLNKEDSQQMIKFFINYYDVLFEGKKIKSFKFIKYLN